MMSSLISAARMRRRGRRRPQGEASGTIAVLALLSILLLSLPAAVAQMPAIQIQGGFINVAVPAPVSGVQAVDAIAAVDGMEVAQSIINSRNAGKGVKLPDRLATEVYVKFKITVLNTGSDRSQHLQVTSTAVNMSRGAFNGAPPYNPISLDPINKFPDYNVLVGVHPSYSREESVLATQAGLITMHCCTPTPQVYTSRYGQDSRFLFSMQRSLSVYANNFLAAMARRGVQKIALVYSAADPSSEEACFAVKNAALANDIQVPYTSIYDYGVSQHDLQYAWGKETGLGRPKAGDTGISGGSSASDPAISTSPMEAQLQLFAENLVASLYKKGITTVVHCGLATDTAIILNTLLATRNMPLDGVFTFPAPLYQRNATSTAQWQQFYEDGVLKPRGLPLSADAASVRQVTKALTPSKLQELGIAPRDVRYLMTAAPWTSDARYNDTQLIDANTFVAEFRKLKKYDPPWQAAAGAATLSILARTLQDIFLDCEVLYPRILMMLQDDAAAPCGPDTPRNPYMRWRAAIESGRFDTVIGQVAFNGSHVNEALQPLLLQAQAVGTLAPPASNELQGVGLAIVAPVSQARYISGQAPKMPSGETQVVDPAPAAIVYPAPGSLYLAYFSAFGISTIVVAGISLLTLLYLFRILCKQRYKTAVRKAKYNVLVLTFIFGILLTGWLVTFLGPANVATCNARVVIPTVALTCVLAPLMGKAVHARMQFFSVKAMGMWKYKAKHTWIWLATQLAIDGALLAFWYIRGSFQIFRATCVSLDGGADFFLHAGIFGWKMTQAALAALAVFMIRYITLPYDDGHYMSIVAYHMVVVLALAIGVYILITMGPWNQYHETLAVNNYQYSFPRPVTSSALESILGSPEEAYLAGSIAIMVFGLWICWFTVLVTIYRKFKEAFAERNTIAEAAALRKRAKREVNVGLTRKLQAAAPDGAKSDSAFSFGGKKGANYSEALAASKKGGALGTDSSKAAEMKDKGLKLLSSSLGKIPRFGSMLSSKVDALSGTAATNPLATEGSPNASLGAAGTTVVSPPVSPVSLKINNADGTSTSPTAKPTLVAVSDDAGNNPASPRGGGHGGGAAAGSGTGVDGLKTKSGAVSMSRTGGGGAGSAALVGGAGYRVKEAEDKLRASQLDNKQLRDNVIFLRSQVELLKNEVLRAVEASANQARAAASVGAAAASGPSAPSPGKKGALSPGGKRLFVELEEGSPGGSKDGNEEEEEEVEAVKTPSGRGRSSSNNRSAANSKVQASEVTIPRTANARRASDMLLGLALADARRASVVKALDMPSEFANGMLTKQERRASAVATAIALETVRGEVLATGDAGTAGTAATSSAANTRGRRASFVPNLNDDAASGSNANNGNANAPRRGSVVNLSAPGGGKGANGKLARPQIEIELLDGDDNGDDDQDDVVPRQPMAKKKSSRKGLKKKKSSRVSMGAGHDDDDEAAGIVDSSDDEGEGGDEDEGSDDGEGSSNSGSRDDGADDALGLAQTTTTASTNHALEPSSSFHDGIVRGRWTSTKDAEVQTADLLDWGEGGGHSSRSSTPTTSTPAFKRGGTMSTRLVAAAAANPSKTYAGTLWRNIAAGGSTMLVREATGRLEYAPPSAVEHMSSSFRAQLADGQVLDSSRTTPLRRQHAASGGLASKVLNATKPESGEEQDGAGQVGEGEGAEEAMGIAESAEPTEAGQEASGSYRSGTGTGAGDEGTGSYYSGADQSGSYYSDTGSGSYQSGTGTGTGDWTQTATGAERTTESSHLLPIAGMSPAVADAFSRKTQKLMAWSEAKPSANPLSKPTNAQKAAEAEGNAVEGKAEEEGEGQVDKEEAGGEDNKGKKEKGDVERFMRGKPRVNKFALNLDEKTGLTHKEEHDAALSTFLRAKSTLSKVPLGATDEELRQAVAKGVIVPAGLSLESTGISADDTIALSLSSKAVARPWRSNKAELESTEKVLASGTSAAAVTALVRSSTSKSPQRGPNGSPGTSATPGAPPPPPIPLMPNQVPAEAHGVDPLAHVLLGPSLSATMALSAQDMLNPLTKRTPIAVAVAAAAEAAQADSRRRLLEGTLGVAPSSPTGPGGSSGGVAFLNVTSSPGNILSAKQLRAGRSVTATTPSAARKLAAETTAIMTGASNGTGTGGAGPSSPDRESTGAAAANPAARLAAAARPVSLTILAANKALLEAEAALEARAKRAAGQTTSRSPSRQ